MHQKKIAFILLFGILVNLFYVPMKAKAWSDLPNLAANTSDTFANIFGDAGIFAQLGTTIGAYVEDNYAKITIEAAKMAALWIVQKTTQAIIGSGNGGGTITDWNNYLYVNPQQRAMAQMNSFFNTVSRGRLSSINYEGVGPINYDSYLVSQAKASIIGSPFQTNLQSQVTDPSQLFAAGNMKGIMTYMQCANNVACYTLTSSAVYAQELSKAQEIAKLEQDRGFLPQKKNGVIVKPAVLLSSAFTQIDQLGTNVIMNADATNGLTAGLAQISEGAAMNIAARSLNYATSDATGKAAIQNKNDQFPFSLAYSSNGGLGFSTGGLSANFGVGAIGTSGQIGNTAFSGGIVCNGPACQTTSASQKTNSYQTTIDSKTTGAAPSLSVNNPAVTCQTDSNCNPGGGSTFACVNKVCKIK